MKEYKHPSFSQPDNINTPIWRYMRRYKFEWLIDEKRLYMPCATVLGDSLESTMPSSEHTWWENRINCAKPNEHPGYEKNYDFSISYSKFFQNKYFVSCWHMFDELSPSKWKYYPIDAEEYVAVRTTYLSLTSFLPKWIKIGKVNYIDSSKDCLSRRPGIDFPNFFEYIMWKEKSMFDYERESRAVADKISIEQYDPDNFFLSNKNKTFVYAPPINLTEILQDVWVHPNCTNEHHKWVNEKLQTIGFTEALRNK